MALARCPRVLAPCAGALAITGQAAADYAQSKRPDATQAALSSPGSASIRRP